RHTSSYGDWSSDVCSSDLARFRGHVPQSPYSACYGFQPNPHRARSFPALTRFLAASSIAIASLAYGPARISVSSGLSREANHSEIGRASCRERGEEAWCGG